LENYGKIYYWQGDYSNSCACYEEAILLFEKVGILPSWVQAHLAYAELRRGNSSRAKELYKVCIQQFQKADMGTGLVFVIEGLASLDTNQGRPERAARLFACADVHRVRGGDLRPPVEQSSVEHDLEWIHSQLDETAFNRVWDEGSAITLDQALAIALDEPYE